MQIEIHHPQETAVRRQVHRGWEETERRPAQDSIVLGGILPNGTKRPTMSERNVVKFLVASDGDSMWPINIDRHVTGRHFVIDARALWSKPDQRNLVGSFGQDVNELVFVGF